MATTSAMEIGNLVHESMTALVTELRGDLPGPASWRLRSTATGSSRSSVVVGN